MTDQPVSSRPSILGQMAAFMAGGATLGLVVVVGLGAISVMQSDRETPITEAFGRALGEIEGGQAQGQMVQSADLAHRLALAQAEVQRLSDYYAGLYQAMGIAAQQANQWEGDLLRRMADMKSSGNAVEVFGANVLSVGCIGAVLDPSSSEARALCDAKDELEGGMTEDFRDIVSSRPRIVEAVLRDFPHPTALVSDEYRRIQAEFPGAYPDAE